MHACMHALQIWVKFWQETRLESDDFGPEVLERCWKGAGKVLERCLPGAGKVLACLHACMPCNLGANSGKNHD